MKFFKTAACFAACALATDSMLQAQDPALVQQALTDMLSQANGNLAQAERHHKHAVNRGRKSVTKQFAEDAKTYGSVVGEYATKLSKAEMELQHVVNDTKVAMAQEAALPHKDTDWQDPSFLETAKLSAQLGAAERAVKKLAHRRERSVHQTESQVESPFEDEASSLGMKLGDLTELLETAKTSFESQVTDVVKNASSPVADLKAKGKVVGKKAKEDGKEYLKDAVARIEALEKNLASQTKKSQADVTVANKNVNLLIAKETKDIEAKTLKVKQSLEVSNDKELKFVGGLKAPAALLKKKNVTKDVKVANATKKAAPKKAEAAPKKAAPKKAEAAAATPKKALRH